MTDLPIDVASIPARLGMFLEVTGDGVTGGHLVPVPEMCERGVVPLAAVVMLVDAAAGVSLDRDPEAWVFTSDLTVRIPLAAPPTRIDCHPVVLRAGHRSGTVEVGLTVDGESWGHSFSGFARVARRDTDPVKFGLDSARADQLRRVPPIAEPLRAAAGFTTLDAAHGVVSCAVRPDLVNPAGALQGAMVAGLAEAAAEDLADHLRLLGTDRHVATEIELRYLAQNRTGPIVTSARVVGPPDAGLVRVDLHDDDGHGRLTTSAVLRLRPAPAPGP